MYYEPTADLATGVIVSGCNFLNSDNYSNGLYLYGLSGALVKNCVFTFTNNDYGIQTWKSLGEHFENDQFVNNVNYEYDILWVPAQASGQSVLLKQFEVRTSTSTP